MRQKFGKVEVPEPQVPPQRRGSEVPRAKTPFTDAVVFMVGGGNYIKCQSLQEYARSKSQSRIRHGQEGKSKHTGLKLPATILIVNLILYVCKINIHCSTWTYESIKV